MFEFVYDPILVIDDIVVFLLATYCAYLAFKKVRLVIGTRWVLGWWWIFPTIMIWTAGIRLAYVLAGLGYIPLPMVPYISGLQIVFYSGMAIFLWKFVKNEEEILKEVKK